MKHLYLAPSQDNVLEVECFMIHSRKLISGHLADICNYRKKLPLWIFLLHAISVASFLIDGQTQLCTQILVGIFKLTRDYGCRSVLLHFSTALKDFFQEISLTLMILFNVVLKKSAEVLALNFSFAFHQCNQKTSCKIIGLNGTELCEGLRRN